MIRLHRLSMPLIAGALISACTVLDHDARTPQAVDVTVMTFNVENLFDNNDDPGKDDKTYLPIAAKQDPAHIDACNTIDVDRWRRD